MKQKTIRVFIDQYRHAEYAYTVKHLQQQVGGRVSKIYVDKKDGSTVHIGYVVGHRWFTEHQRVERKV